MTSCKITTVKMTRECPVSFLAPTAMESHSRPHWRPKGEGECQGKQESPRQPGAFCFNSWWSRRDLNPRPCACKAPALPLRHATEHITRLNARVRIVPQVPRRSKWKAGRRDDSASRAPRGTAPTAQRAARSRHGAHGATSAQRPRHCRQRRRWSRASGPPRAP